MYNIVLLTLVSAAKGRRSIGRWSRGGGVCTTNDLSRLVTYYGTEDEHYYILCVFGCLGERDCIRDCPSPYRSPDQYSVQCMDCGIRAMGCALKNCAKTCDQSRTSWKCGQCGQDNCWSEVTNCIGYDMANEIFQNVLNPPYREAQIPQIQG